MTARPTLDVSHLPADVRDTRDHAWWGIILFMLIETTTVLLLVASYLYLWRNYQQSDWPPPLTDRVDAILRPLPDLLFGTANVLLLVGSVLPAVGIDFLCRKQFDELEQLNVAKPSEAPATVRPPERPVMVMAGSLLLAFLGTLSIVLRLYEFPGLKVNWNENAYGGLVWTLLGLHLLYVAVEVVEVVVLFVWTAIYGLGENQSLDVILTAAYWYWTVAVGVLVYGLVYWFPRVV